MAEWVKAYHTGTCSIEQFADGSVILHNDDGDAVTISREDLAGVAREITAAHVHAGRLKLDQS